MGWDSGSNKPHICPCVNIIFHWDSGLGRIRRALQKWSLGIFGLKVLSSGQDDLHEQGTGTEGFTQDRIL